MGNFFPTCLLIRNDSAPPQLVPTEVSLHPGRSFPPSQEKNILLAGGFTSLFPETEFSLSPTLQLNSDRTFLPQDKLTQLAIAEFERINRISYGSYVTEADNRVCVIGDKEKSINKFLDTYGGILEIEPLLLNGQDREIPTVTGLHLHVHDGALHLEYQVRIPVRNDICSYCGACGSVCPEKSISPDLFLDFGTCTLCGECETVCEVGAIDVNRIENREISVPALIILDGVEIELPEEKDAIYFENDLDSYFTTLFPCQVDEVVSCDNLICQYSARLKIGCSLCLSSCSYGAVEQGIEGVSIDSLKCEECGACVAVCPTGAMQNKRFDDESFVKFFQSIDFLADSTVVIGDEGALHSFWWQTREKRFKNVFFLEYSNVQSLSLFHFMLLFSQQAGKIVLVTESAEGVELMRQVSLANSLISSLYNTIGRVVICRAEEVESHLSPASQLDALGSRGEQKLFVNRRRELSNALQNIVANSGKVADVKPTNFISFATLTCNNERCTHCLACLNDCRILALSADAGRLTLDYTGSMCVACGLCVQVCPEDALELSPQFMLQPLFFKSVEMAKAEPMACRSCGKVFGTRKSFERVMEILSKKETVDTSHFEYCDTCRVVKLFESEE